MTEYFQAHDYGEHFGLRRISDNGSLNSHVAFLTKVGPKEVEEIVNKLNEASRFHLPDGEKPIRVFNK